MFLGISPLLTFGDAAGAAGMQVARSLRFNAVDTAYLIRTLAVSNQKKFTISFWHKRGRLGANTNLFSSGGSTTEFNAYFDTTDRIEWYYWVGSYSFRKVTNRTFRDSSAWMHFTFIYDSDNATAEDRNQIWINGVRETSWNVSGNAGAALQVSWNSNVNHQIGRTTAGSFFYGDGYFCEVHHIDGQALPPSNFGEADPVTGVWRPKAYSGAYGTNGFKLLFADNSNTTSGTLGKDTSGNNIDWTPNGFSVAAGAGNDSLLDTPTPYGTDTGLGGEVRGNYATLNPLNKNVNAALSNGNLQPTNTGGDFVNCATIPSDIDNVYAEARYITGRASFGMWTVREYPNGAGTWNDPWGAVIFNSNAGLQVTRKNNTDTNARSADAANDIWQVAYKPATKELWLGRNNTWFGGGSPSAGTSPTYTLTATEHYYVMAAGSVEVNFGQKAFSFAAPTGFKCLVANHIATPAIVKPALHIDIGLRTGTAAVANITGKLFPPDFVMTKCRSTTGPNTVNDTSRGVNKQVFSNAATDEETQTDQLTAFNSDGFTLGANAAGSGSVNKSAVTYVDWSWKKSAAAGIDIVLDTGTGVAHTVAHALGKKPELMIRKNRNNDGVSTSWATYNARGFDKIVYVMSSAAEVTDTLVWNAEPTSSVFSVGTWAGSNGSGVTFVTYLFASIPGFSKIGTYLGSGSGDGAFVYTDFTPRWIMIKRCDGNGNWHVWDTQRYPMNTVAVPPELYLDLTNAENAGHSRPFEIVSNGFKLRHSEPELNASNGIYLYAAFAETPFKYARAR